jgi:hypothetical protein
LQTDISHPLRTKNSKTDVAAVDAMTEVGGIDLSRLLHSKLNESHAIVLRHKRKLRELLSVATLLETLPGDGLNKPDATTANATEAIFLQANDISQYVFGIDWKFFQGFISASRYATADL